MSVVSVSLSPSHSFSKIPVSSITLIANFGVKGDAHGGATAQHRPHLNLDPPAPNLRQVHLIQSEILASVGSETMGKPMKPGELGENITTAGVDLLSLGKGTKLRFIDATTRVVPTREVAVVEVTGLRDAGPRIDQFQKGLQERLLVRDGKRRIVERRAGIMGIVEVGGEIKSGMRIVVERPSVHQKLECV
ncbi:hypothetical protein PAAG_02678 [Paracoccidioides lutzii Pb01]|uniref:MOSC domain-containing protein n=1 Tax=Paracoccidioides lutzii (strain ATCC MYA-826 / Pb01) TaxID=502779 RepID=C1GVY3_PARBA|nr:hypothetical protein PAAG_02678 [Paracoccidioides lutzii Pb01]EEH40702.2 hypothetical protein PAAG_02678 [Paracoccidioides lutzii Pb01]